MVAPLHPLASFSLLGQAAGMNNAMPVGSITAIILAGHRPGPDPLRDFYGVATKALIPIAGVPMLRRVADAVRAAPAIGGIIVLAQNSGQLAQEPAFASLANDPRVHFAEADDGISHSLSAVIDRMAGPFLVTTADHALLTPAMIAAFLAGVSGADVAAAMVEQRVLLARYPQSRRTWIKLRGGAWSGANLFWLRGAQARPVLDFWQGIERDRKKGRKIIAAFGPMLMLGAGLRLLTIQQAVARAGRRFGVAARIVPMSQAEACIDADKPDDIALIEQILADRGETAPVRDLSH